MNGVRTGSLTLAFALIACRPEIEAPDIVTVSLESTATVRVGESTELRANLVGTDEAVDAGVTWSSSDESVATVSSTGSVHGVRKGTAIITATSVHQTFSKARCTVTVTGPNVLVITALTRSVAVGQSIQLTGVVKDDAGNTLPESVSFSSSSANVSVTSDGLVTGLSAGVGLVLATSVSTHELVSVTVTPAVFAVAMTPATLSLKPGDTGAFVCAARNVANNEVAPTAIFTWTSSNIAAASVSQTGSVTAIADGTSSVTCALVGDTAKASGTVTVSTPPLTITAAPAAVSLAVGETQTLAIAATDAAGAVVTGRTVTYVSSNDGIATVSSTGVVTGVAAGSATVTATVGGAGGGSVSIPVVVAGLTLTISPPTLSLEAGTSGAFTCTVKNATTGATVNQAVTWSSSAAGIATVTQSGSVSALSQGTATIACSVPNGGTPATATVTVTQSPLVITVSPSSITTPAGFLHALTVVVKTQAGAVVTGRTITYTSQNTGIVVVDESGQYAGIAPGTTTITVTVSGPGGGSVVVPVTIT